MDEDGGNNMFGVSEITPEHIWKRMRITTISYCIESNYVAINLTCNSYNPSLLMLFYQYENGTQKDFWWRATEPLPNLYTEVYKLKYQTDLIINKLYKHLSNQGGK